MSSDPPNNLASSYGMGYKLLKQMGFSQGEGVGKKHGIAVPLSHGDLRPKQAGLGYYKEETNASIDLGKASSSLDGSLQHKKNPQSLKEHARIQKKKVDLIQTKVEPLSSILGDAREMMMPPVGMEHVVSSSDSGLKKVLEVEERWLFLMKTERDSIEIQVPIYEALDELTRSLSSAISMIKQKLSEKLDEPHIWLQEIFQSHIIEKVKLFYIQMEEKSRATITSKLEDKVSGELHRAINDAESKAASVLSATNNILSSLLIPLHRKGSLMETNIYFPAVFTRKLLPVYLQMENVIGDRISGPFISQYFILGLLLPAIKIYIRSASLREVHSPIVWWLEVLPWEIVENIMETVVIPQLKEVGSDFIDEVVQPWLPFLNSEKTLICLCECLLSSPFDSAKQLEEILTVLRGIGRIPASAEHFLAERLSSFLLKNLKIDPEEQELDALETVIEASDVVSLDLMAGVLANGLFPLLSSYAAAWMRSCTVEDLRTSAADDIFGWFVGFIYH